MPMYEKKVNNNGVAYLEAPLKDKSRLAKQGWEISKTKKESDNGKSKPASSK